VFSSGILTFLYVLENARTKLHLSVGSDMTYYSDLSNSQSYELNEHITLSLAYNISPRLSVSLNVYGAYRTEPDFSQNAGVESRQGNFFETYDTLSLSYHWTSAFSTDTTVYGRRISYERSSVGAFEDRWEGTGGQEFRFTLPHQTTTLVAEYRFEVIDYDTFPRDSTTHFVLAGFDEEFNPNLKLTGRGGATLRSYENDGKRTAPHFELSLEYAGAHQFLVGWHASYGIEEPNSPTVLDRVSFRTGLQVTYNLSARIRSVAAVYYHHDENRTVNVVGVPLSDSSSDSVDASLGLSYTVSRFLFVNLGYDHSEVSSLVSPAYSRNRYSGGFTLNF
jgi:hypothetical protein